MNLRDALMFLSFTWEIFNAIWAQCKKGLRLFSAVCLSGPHSHWCNIKTHWNDSKCHATC